MASFTVNNLLVRRPIVRAVPKRADGAVMGIVLFWTVLVLCAFSFSETFLRGALIASTATAICLPFVMRAARGALDLLEPIVPAGVALLIMFVMRPIADQALSNYNHLGFDISAEFDLALLTVFVGCASLSLGYLCGMGHVFRNFFPKPGLAFPRKKVFRAALITAVIGVGVYGAFLGTHGGISTLSVFLAGRSRMKFELERNSSGYIYPMIFLLIPATMVFFTAWLRFKRGSMLVGAICSGLLILLYETSQGDRSQMLPLLLGLPTIFYLYKDRRPTFRQVLITSVFALAIFTLLREIRNSEGGGRKNIQAVLSDSPGDTFLKTFTRDDSEMFDTLANVISVVPRDIPFQPQALVTDVATRVVPRAFYPNKPLESLDKVVQFMWPFHFRFSKAASASSIFGNFYMYGGILAVALGAFATGVLLNQLWIWLTSQSNNINAILLYAFVPAFVVIFLRGTITDTCTRMLFIVAPAFLGHRYWRRG